MMLFPKPNADGYVAGETAETFKSVSLETLEYVAVNARSAARRKLAEREILRRKSAA